MSPFTDTLGRIEKIIESRIVMPCRKIRVDGCNSGHVTLCFTCWTMSGGYSIEFARYKNFRMYKFPSSKLRTEEEISTHLENEEKILISIVDELAERCLSKYIK